MRHYDSLGILLVVLCFAALGSAQAHAADPGDATLFKPPLPAGPEGDTFTFVVIGDTRPHRRGAIEMPQQFLDNIAAVNGRKPVFSINVGDLINGYLDDLELVGKQWNGYLAAVRTFDQPLFSVVGNHDVWDEPSEKYFVERFGDLRWYSFDYGPVHFIVLDSDVAGQMNRITDTQLEWLEQDLESSGEAEFTFVFLHKPLWRSGGYGSQWNDEVAPLLVEHGITAVFAGHEHWYQKDAPRDGIAYYITGGGGAEMHAAEFTGSFYHFMEVTVDGDDVSYVVNRGGTMLSEDVVTAAQVNELRKLERGTVTRMVMPPATLDTGMAGTARFEVTNPTPYTFDYALALEMPSGGTADSVSPRKGRLAPGEQAWHEFTVATRAPSETRPLGSPALRVNYDVRCPHILSKVSSRTLVPINAVLPDVLPGPSDVDRCAKLDGQTAAIQIPFTEVLNVTGPFTIEAWFSIEELGWRVGGMTHTENSSYGLFLAEANEPRLRFLVSDATTGHYAEAKGEEPTPTGRWVHVACTSDGETLAIWLDGTQVAEADAPEKIRPNELPMYVGADVAGSGDPTSFLKGQVDEFRLSTVCRYTEDFEPVTRFEPDEDTLILYHLDRVLVNRIVDYSGNGHHGTLLGNAEMVER